LEVRPKTYDPVKPTSVPHPLDQLSVAETEKAGKIIVAGHSSDVVIQFRSIFLEEPAKKDLIVFLDAEHAGNLTAKTPRPVRLAKIQYDVVKSDKSHEYVESVVDLGTEKETVKRVVDNGIQASMTT